MELSDRKRAILQAIIEDYISTAEPVGSRNIAKNHDLGLSAATIRNEMADLEDRLWGCLRPGGEGEPSGKGGACPPALPAPRRPHSPSFPGELTAEGGRGLRVWSTQDPLWDESAPFR